MSQVLGVISANSVRGSHFEEMYHEHTSHSVATVIRDVKFDQGEANSEHLATVMSRKDDAELKPAHLQR